MIIMFDSPVYSMTMDDVAQYAINNNPELVAQRLEERMARGQLEKASLLLKANPTIEGTVSKKERAPGEEGDKFTNYGFKLSQEFEIAGQRGARIDIAEKEISTVVLVIKDKERLLISEVKDSFGKVLALRKKSELAQEVVRLQEELLGLTKIKFQAGEVSGLDVNLAEVELSKAKRELLLVEREYRESLLALKGLMGLNPDMPLSVEGDLPSAIPNLPDKEVLKTVAFSERPDLKTVALEVRKTEAVIGLINKETVPNVTLAGFYGKDEQKNEVGLTITIPLPFFDRKQGERLEGRAKAEQAKIKVDGLKRTIEREIEQAYTALESALEELSIFKEEILNKAAENLNLLNLAFKEGKIGFFEVRLAQKETVDIQFAYLDSQLRMRIALNAIERVTGGSLKWQ
jgi:cobalt-zinc-cadmium efflux system outer membrane protein